MTMSWSKNQASSRTKKINVILSFRLIECSSRKLCWKAEVTRRRHSSYGYDYFATASEYPSRSYRTTLSRDQIED